ncbi:MAG: chemotaxis protein MotB [Limisphaerales bacterium]
MEVSQSPEHVTLTFTNEILFKSGSAKISELGIRVIQQVASHLQSLEDFAVVVAGHTDNIPIVLSSYCER